MRNPQYNSLLEIRELMDKKLHKDATTNIEGVFVMITLVRSLSRKKQRRTLGFAFPVFPIQRAQVDKIIDKINNREI